MPTTSQPKTVMPQATDLDRLLQGAGIRAKPPTTLESCLDLGFYCANAMDDFERDTGYRPFVVDTVGITRTFDPQGDEHKAGRGGYGWGSGPKGGSAILDLGAGLVICTSVTTGINSSTGLGGTVRTLNTDYWMRPHHAIAEKKPWTWIEFAGPLYGGRDSVQVVGQWGYAAPNTTAPFIIPMGAWGAVLRRAGVLACPEMGVLISGGLIEISESDATERFAPHPLKMLEDAWQSQYDQAVMSRFALVTCP